MADLADTAGVGQGLNACDKGSKEEVPQTKIPGCTQYTVTSPAETLEFEPGGMGDRDGPRALLRAQR